MSDGRVGRQLGDERAVVDGKWHADGRRRGGANAALSGRRHRIRDHWGLFLIERQHGYVHGMAASLDCFDLVGDGLARRDTKLQSNQVRSGYELDQCVVARQADLHVRHPGQTVGIDEGDRIQVGRQQAHVLFVPSHTTGHVAYVFDDAKDVFTGDMLFAAGCGRLFEGDARMMFDALCVKLAALPDDTLVFHSPRG